jgi:hypothetical protein
LVTLPRWDLPLCRNTILFRQNRHQVDGGTNQHLPECIHAARLPEHVGKLREVNTIEVWFEASHQLVHLSAEQWFPISLLGPQSI